MAKPNTSRVIWLLPALQSNARRAYYLIDNVPAAQAKARKLLACGRDVRLREYVGSGTQRLTGPFCDYWRMCNVCAGIRQRRIVRENVRRFMTAFAQQPNLKLVLITLTVANGPDLDELVSHLLRSWARLLGRRADALSKGRGRTEWQKAVGGYRSAQINKGSNSGEWHPHLHVLALYTGRLAKDAMATEWLAITGDSHVVHVKPIPLRRPVHEGSLRRKLRAALRYVTDLTELSPEDAWEVHCKLKGRKLALPWGDLRHIDVSEEKQTGPYIQERFHLAGNEFHNWRDWQRLVNSPEEE